MNQNIFVALRNGFPLRMHTVAVETADQDKLAYSWQDLERGTAMMANLLASLDLPAVARILVQTDKSVEALMLYLSVLRAGYVYVPLNPAYQQHEMRHF